MCSSARACDAYVYWGAGEAVDAMCRRPGRTGFQRRAAQRITRVGKCVFRIFIISNSVCAEPAGLSHENRRTGREGRAALMAGTHTDTLNHSQLGPIYFDVCFST